MSHMTTGLPGSFRGLIARTAASLLAPRPRTPRSAKPPIVPARRQSPLAPANSVLRKLPQLLPVRTGILRVFAFPYPGLPSAQRALPRPLGVRPPAKLALFEAVHSGSGRSADIALALLAHSQPEL